MTWRESSHRYQRGHFLTLALISVLAFSFPSGSRSQWKQVAGTGATDSNTVLAPGAISNACGIGIGFISFWHRLDSTADMERTDLGAPHQTWLRQRVTSLTNFNGAVWWFVSVGPTFELYQTTDSGQSWTSIGSTPQLYHIYYDSLSHRLIGIGSKGLYYSTDNGSSWVMIAPSQHCMFAFSTPLLGVTSGITGTPMLFTTDAGVTWQPNSLLGTEFQPLGIAGTSVFFAIGSDGPEVNHLLRSNDGGANWTTINVFPSADTMTGCIVGDICHLYAQTSQQVLVSTDEGLSWQSLGGPGTTKNTALWSNGFYTFADNHESEYQPGWFGQQLYEYTLPKPVLTILPGSDSITSCVRQDLTFQFYVAGDCRKSIANIIGIGGSQAFSLTRKPSLPDSLFADDSVRVRYDPVPDRSDTAYLLMSVCTPEGVIDTSIRLIGRGLPPPPSFHLSTKVSPAVIHANDIVTMQVYPDQLIKNAQLNTLDLDLSFLDDLLEVVSVKTMVAGAVVSSGAGNVVGGQKQLPVRINGNDMTLDPSQPVLEIAFRAFLSDSTSTDLTLSNLKLNGSDPSYQCKLAADIASPNVTIQLQCGDPTVQQFLRRKNLVLTSVHPNPANRSVSVSLSGGVNAKVKVAIYDVLGNLVLEQTSQLSSSEALLELDLSKLVAGAYIVRASDDRGMASSKRLVVER